MRLKLLTASLLLLSCTTTSDAHQFHNKGLVDTQGQALYSAPLLAPSTSVTIAAPYEVEGQDGTIVLEGGTMSFDGKSWTYRGNFHGSGTIVFVDPKFMNQRD